MPCRDEIIQQAMALSPADRAFVADALDNSLVDGGFATPEVAQAWVDEVERRIKARDQDESRSIEIGAALAIMRRALHAKREQESS
jgi:hypothetical protein